MQRLKGMVKAAAGRALAQMERPLLAVPGAIEHAPIFIVGAPRSGSTLLYQLVAQRFKVCYFSNAMMMFPDAPAALSRFLSALDGCSPHTDFRSYFGNTYGWRGPNQGYKAWDRWFPTDRDHVAWADIPAVRREEMRRTIASLQHRFDAPFVNKWQRNAARIAALAQIFPESIFVQVLRDKARTAQSLLYGRQTFLRDEATWLSVKPRNYRQIRTKTPIEQVCEQVFFLEREISADLESYAPHRYVVVRYEALCHDTHGELDRIRSSYDTVRPQAPLRVRGHVPASFPLSEQERVSTDEDALIRRHLSELEISHAAAGSSGRGDDCALPESGDLRAQ
jgi:hypothetical protein